MFQRKPDLKRIIATIDNAVLKSTRGWTYLSISRARENMSKLTELFSRAQRIQPADLDFLGAHPSLDFFKISTKRGIVMPDMPTGVSIHSLLNRLKYYHDRNKEIHHCIEEPGDEGLQTLSLIMHNNNRWLDSLFEATNDYLVDKMFFQGPSVPFTHSSSMENAIESIIAERKLRNLAFSVGMGSQPGICMSTDLHGISLANALTCHPNLDRDMVFYKIRPDNNEDLTISRSTYSLSDRTTITCKGKQELPIEPIAFYKKNSGLEVLAPEQLLDHQMPSIIVNYLLSQPSHVYNMISLLHVYRVKFLTKEGKPIQTEDLVEKNIPELIEILEHTLGSSYTKKISHDRINLQKAITTVVEMPELRDALHQRPEMKKLMETIVSEAKPEGPSFKKR